MPEPTQADLAYCLGELLPEANRLLAEQERCIGIPWRTLRWWRAYRAHKALIKRWREILAGRSHAPPKRSAS